MAPTPPTPARATAPASRAVEELNAYSPLLEHDITKEEVREIAREYGLSVADKPSMACLSSRIPTGLEVTEDRLSRRREGRAPPADLGLRAVPRARPRRPARIEVGEKELDVALDPDFVRAARDHVADLGFDHVTLDLHGYQTGSVSPGPKPRTNRPRPTTCSTPTTRP